MSSRATSASLRAASVDAKFLPKSKSIWDTVIRATVGSNGLSLDVVTVRPEVVGKNAVDETFLDVAAVKLAVICGNSGASA